MLKLNLPDFQFNIKKDKNDFFIFDDLRHRFVALTPEEWVRQNFVRYLIEYKKFPSALMGNEVSLVQNGIRRRCDTLVSDRHGEPLAIVEYKAPSVRLTQSVFDQIVRYNMVLRARYLIVSNGNLHYCCAIDYASNSYSFLKDIPDYDSLCDT